MSRDALFFFLKFSFSRPSFISSIFRSLPLFSPSFCSFFHFLIRFIHYFLLFLLFIPSFPVLCILCSFFLSHCPLFLSFVLSFFRPFILLFLRPFIPSPSPFLSFILSFSLSSLELSFVRSFSHSFYQL